MKFFSFLTTKPFKSAGKYAATINLLFWGGIILLLLWSWKAFTKKTADPGSAAASPTGSAAPGVPTATTAQT